MSKRPSFADYEPTVEPWTITQVGLHFIVTRRNAQGGGHETMHAIRAKGEPRARRISKFRSQEAAREAIARASILEAYEQACRLVPDECENHLAYYADKWARCFNTRESTARAVIGSAA